MKNFSLILIIILIAITGCKKNGGFNNYDTSTTSLPVLTTDKALSITQSTAVCAGAVTNNGNLAITARGICWSTGIDPTIGGNKAIFGKGLGSFSGTITGMLPNTIYHVRSFATNSNGNGYGNDVILITQAGGIGNVSDIDGNTYHSITIGNQVWMIENLSTTHYRNGDPIPLVTDDEMWFAQKTGAYCDFNNEGSNAKVYGKLYNWFAVNDPRNIAPLGWHVPTESEWQILIDYLGRDTTAGGRLKEVGILHWLNPNADATNGYGFTALPAGDRGYHGKFFDLGTDAGWWTSTEHTSTFSELISLTFTDGIVRHLNYPQMDGFSVRCVKDN